LTIPDAPDFDILKSVPYAMSTGPDKFMTKSDTMSLVTNPDIYPEGIGIKEKFKMGVKSFLPIFC
jgi:hypothetical protein